MRSYTSTERFEIINYSLGYGNPHAKIIYIGIEEKQSWELKNIIPKNDIRKKPIENRLIELKSDSIDSKIDAIRNEFEIDLEALVNKQIEEYERNDINHIYANNPSDEFSDTSNIQFKLAKEVLLFLNRYDNNFDWDKYANSKFATKEGNEACLNYYPIARPKQNFFYPEEQYFFGTPLENKFSTPEHKTKRIEYFENFLKDIKKRMADQDIFIFLMGQDPYLNLKSTIENVFQIDFSEKNAGDKFILNDNTNRNKIIANKERNIWSFNHPSARIKYNPFSKEDVKVVIEELNKKYRKKEV